MGNDIEKIKIESAMAVKELYGVVVLDVESYDNGNVKVTTDKGEFLKIKSGGYVVKEGQ